MQIAMEGVTAEFIVVAWDDKTDQITHVAMYADWLRAAAAADKFVRISGENGSSKTVKIIDGYREYLDW